MPFLCLLLIMRAKCLFLFSSHQPTNKAEDFFQEALSHYEMNLTYNCSVVMHSGLEKENRKQRALSKPCAISAVCPFCSHVCMLHCLAFYQDNINERGNNQRPQYFTLHTDACSYTAGRRDLLAPHLRSDIMIQCYISLSRSLVIPSMPPPPLPSPPSTSVHSACLPDCS